MIGNLDLLIGGLGLLISVWRSASQRGGFEVVSSIVGLKWFPRVGKSACGVGGLGVLLSSIVWFKEVSSIVVL